MAVTISNIAARQITCNSSGTITWGSWSTNLNDFWAGSYNANTKYVAEVRFRVSQPCSAVSFTACSYASNYYGTVYWKYSANESDATLAKASYQSGQSYDGSTAFTGSYTKKTITINGAFKANTDYYIYGFNYAAGSTWSATHMYALYGGGTTYYTKVTDGTAVTAYQLSLSAGANSSISVNRTSSSYGATGALSSGAAIYYGDKLTITFTPASYYYISTRTVNGSAFTSGGSHTVSGNVSVVSAATKNSYNVAYNANGGTSTPTTQSGQWDTSVTLAAAIAKSNTDSTGTITVSYNANGGSSTPSAGTGTYTNTTPYTFNKWALNSTSGTQYAAKASFTIPKSHSTMYALWTTGTTTRKSNPSITTAAAISRANAAASRSITITYDANGGSGAPSATSHTQSGTTSYTFSKWRDADHGTDLAASTSYTFSVNCTLTAQWTSSTSYSACSATLSSTVPTRDGYTFKGWATSASATSGTAAGGTMSITESITVYAVWEIAGAVRIWDGSAWVMALPYVYDGSAWKQCVPYLYNGSAWKRCN